MTENKYAVMEEIELNEDSFDFEALEQSLESELSSQMDDLEILEKDRNMIGNPSSLGESVMNVVWEQFINQVGVYAGEEFIKENRGLTLDLSNDAHIITIDNYGKEGVGSHNFIVKSEEFIKNNHNQTLDLSNDAHIQTAENFANGKIATHNHISKEQLEQNYDRYKNTPHKEFRKKYVNPGMDDTLKRAGALKEQGIDTVKDIYTGRQIPTETKLENGKNNPKAAQREHVDPSANVYQNPSLQMAYDSQELADIINDPENLQGYTTAERNNRKSDRLPDEMENRDKNKHWEKANERAEKHIKQKEQEGEERLEKEGKQTQKEEEARSIEAGKQSQREEAFRIGGTALRAALMGLLAELIKTIIKKLIVWFRAGKKNIKSFIKSVKDAIDTFITNLKEYLISAVKNLLKAIATAIIGPVVNTITKVWIFLKQGYKSLKEAIDYVRNSKNKPFSILMLEVGKIIIAGLTAGSAIVLGEVITNGLSTIPGFNTDLGFGSFAGISGIFFGALIAGIIGAIALNLIDKAVAKKQKTLNTQQQIDKKNEILHTQDQLIIVSAAEANNEKMKMAHDIVERHKMAVDTTRVFVEKIKTNEVNSRNIQKHNNDILDSIDNMLDNL